MEGDVRPFSPLLREIFDRMPAGVAVFDRDLCVVEWNASFARFLEENRPELAAALAPGAALASVSPWDLDLVTPLFQQALRGETVTLDASPYHGTHGATYWDIVLSPLYEHGEIVGVLDTTTEATRRVVAAREAREREGLFRLVFDATSDAVILNDFDTGFVADANPAAAEMHGFTLEEFVGIDPRRFIHPDSLPLLGEYQERVRAGKDFRSRAQDIRKDGSVFDVEVMGTSIEYRGKKYLAAVVRDISDQVAAERDRARAQQVLREAQATLEHRVQERTEELASVLDVSKAVLSTLDLDTIFERVLDEVGRVIPYSGCALTILDGDELEVIAAKGLVRPELSARAIGVRFPLARSPRLWETMLDGRPFTVRDAHSESEPEALAFKDFISAHPVVNLAEVRSWLLVPMIHQGEVLGVLSISRANPDAFDQSNAQLASTFAAQVAVAIANARLYQQSLRRAREMEGLASIAGALTFEMPSQEALEVLAGRVVAASSAVAATLLIYSANGEFEACGAAGLPRGYIDAMVRAITVEGAPSAAQHAFRGAQRQVVHDARLRTLREERFSEAHDYLHHAPWDVTVMNPLNYRGRALGTLTTYYPQSQEPDAEELRLLSAIADQLSIGLENADLFEQLRRRVNEMDSLYAAEEHLHQSLVLDDVLQSLTNSALEVVRPDLSTALVFDESPPHEFKVGAVAGMSDSQKARLAESLVGLNTEGIRQLSVPRVLPDTRDDVGPARRVIDAAEVASLIDVPITVGGKRFAFFSLGWRQRHYITEAEVRLASALGQQAAVAIENARLYERSQVAASLEERQRLARELHDSVSQALYGISLGTRTARALIDREPARAIEPLDYVGTLAEAGLAELRALIFELRPESLAMEGLVAALEKQFAALRARHGIEVATSLCVEPDLRLDLKEVLYRVGQEALHNTVKHAKAKHVSVALAAGPEIVTLEIADDGIGFDPTADYPGHLGLRSMSERAARAGGHLEITSSPATGTRVKLEVPATPGHLPGQLPG